jgi:uncharacterized protein (DUF2147 family)
MLRRIAPIVFALAFAGSALAAEPTGAWLVENGYAHIKVDICGDRLWGIISWEQKASIDRNNPDATKRTRPTLGIPILLGMTQVKPNRWDGEIYNSEDGRTYTAHISLAQDDVLRVEGCVLGFLCGGQNWTRVEPPKPAAQASAPPARPAAATKPPPAATAVPAAPNRTTGQATRNAPPATPAANPTDDVCPAVAAATGQPLDKLMQTGSKRTEK